jgi:hypothetical protein
VAVVRILCYDRYEVLQQHYEKEVEEVELRRACLA